MSEVVPIASVLSKWPNASELNVRYVSESGKGFWETALHLAVREDQLQNVRELLKSGANPVRVNSAKMPCWLLAIEAGNLEVVMAIDAVLDNVNYVIDGKTALFIASSRNGIELVHFLLQRGARGDLSLLPAVHTAAALRHWETLQLLIPLEKSFDTQARLTQDSGDRWATPLTCALTSGKASTMDRAFKSTMLLLEAGADPNARPTRDLARDEAEAQWPIHMVFKRFQGQYRFDLVRKFHQCGVDLSQRAIDGTTILHLASYMHDVPMIQFLLEEAHLTPDARGNRGQTPLHDCIRSVGPPNNNGADLSKACQVAEILLQAGANIPYKPHLRMAGSVASTDSIPYELEKQEESPALKVPEDPSKSHDQLCPILSPEDA
ncbi:hypothetical protein H2202_010915 [Exophiala xenobiotica]|nr:hypothetical protein H2202_010915 [Exophiala xenobiotica]